MDMPSATRFKAHVEEAIKELSSALVLAQQASTAEEFSTIRRSVGDLIARADTLLLDSISSGHPALEHRPRHRGGNGRIRCGAIFRASRRADGKHSLTGRI